MICQACARVADSLVQAVGDAPSWLGPPAATQRRLLAAERIAEGLHRLCVGRASCPCQHRTRKARTDG